MSNLRVCALMLVSADVIHPSLDWVLNPRAPVNLVPLMAKLRDPEGFAELITLCETSSAGRTLQAATLRRAATILAIKGGTLRQITVGDCLELSVAIDGRSLRTNKAMVFYEVLRTMGVFGPHAPTTLRAFSTCGQLSPTQLIDRYPISCRPVRDVLVSYLQERQPALDHDTLSNLAFTPGRLFWWDLEHHHPGIAGKRVDSALLIPAIRGALPADDPRTTTTLTTILDDLGQDGFMYRFRHDERPLGEAEGAFVLCGFMTSLALHQQGREVEANRWFERNRAACGPPGLYSEEYDTGQRQMRGNMPQAFVHALMLETAQRLATPWPTP